MILSLINTFFQNFLLVILEIIQPKTHSFYSLMQVRERHNMLGIPNESVLSIPIPSLSHQEFCLISIASTWFCKFCKT
jgi:hypothetical protein